MAQAKWKVTITEHDYNYTEYVAYVSSSSRNQAIVKAAALAGQEKARRELELHPNRGVALDGLMEPDIRMEPADLDEYWAHREEVQVVTP